MFVYSKDNNKAEAKQKRCKKTVTKRRLKFEDYDKCLCKIRSIPNKYFNIGTNLCELLYFKIRLKMQLEANRS